MTNRVTLLAACSLLASFGFAETNELDIARSALRDGLWEVARTHAGRATGDDAKLIVLETYAREQKWKDLLEAFDAMGYPSGEGFTYYRALALYRGGSDQSASNTLAGTAFSDSRFAPAAARLRAELATRSGRNDLALEILRNDGGNEVDTKLLQASILLRDGDREQSERLWREVLATTNVTEEARVEAAVELRDADELRKLLETVRTSELRHKVSLRLGVLLLRDEKTREEGERLIFKAVRESPEHEGSREAFYALARARLAAGDAAGAVATFGEAQEVWPEASRDAEFHDGRGRALARLGRNDEAQVEFAEAEKLYGDPELKALVAVRAADAMSAAGRVTEATAAYQAVRDRYPSSVAAVRVEAVIVLRETEERGRQYYRENRFEDARKVFAELAVKDPQSRERFEYYCVMCLYGDGNDAAAERMARKLSESADDPSIRAKALVWLAKYSFNLGRWHEAGELFSRYAERHPDASDAPQATVWAARSALAENDFARVLSIVTAMLAKYPNAPERAAGMLVQGEALIELARFDEAALVLERAAAASGATDADRLRSRILRADALFAMGADNPVRYDAALEAYTMVRTVESLTPDDELTISFKIARTLEKLRRYDESFDTYYTQVVLAYRTARLGGIRFGDAARATFSRAAFRLAEEYESRGRFRQAAHVLDLVRTSDVPAADEARRRIDALYRKGVL